MVKGIVIAGTHSGCGKTTVTLGILSALTMKGLKVQPFKAGPDFIDTGLHTAITGVPSRNLDIWMCGEHGVKECFSQHTADVDTAVVEGVMGMYDGHYSTAALANLLKVPVILVVDAYGMAESAGAIVQGFISYHGAPEFIGVIFNRVSSPAHFDMLRHAVRGVPVLGYLPDDADFRRQERHLGLTTAQESPLAPYLIEKLGEAVRAHIDMDSLVRSADCSTPSSFLPRQKIRTASSRPGIRIALAYDRAFCFYYEDNLDQLKEEGAEIVRFSPLADREIPDADVLYIGGGYPEIHAQQLSGNAAMLESIKTWVDADKPVYAECGGMMYLSNGIHGFDHEYFSMAGVMPFETKMERSRMHLGYREIVLKEDCILGRQGDRLRGQEFHYSALVNQQPDTLLKTCYILEGQNREEGYSRKRILASYIHVHFCSNPAAAQHFVNFVRKES